MDRVMNSSDRFTNAKYSTYSTTGNDIQSAVVNDGCEIWIEGDDLFEPSSGLGPSPIQTLKAGYYYTLTSIDVRT